MENKTISPIVYAAIGTVLTAATVLGTGCVETVRSRRHYTPSTRTIRTRDYHNPIIQRHVYNDRDRHRDHRRDSRRDHRRGRRRDNDGSSIGFQISDDFYIQWNIGNSSTRGHRDRDRDCRDNRRPRGRILNNLYPYLRHRR